MSARPCSRWGRLALVAALTIGCGSGEPDPAAEDRSAGGEDEASIAPIAAAQPTPPALKTLYVIAYPPAGHVSEDCNATRAGESVAREEFDRAMRAEAEATGSGVEAFMTAMAGYLSVARSCGEHEDTHAVACRNAGVCLSNAGRAEVPAPTRELLEATQPECLALLEEEL